MEIDYIKTVVLSQLLFGVVRVECPVQELVDENGVLDPAHLSLVHGLHVGRLVLEPADVIGHEVDVLAASAPHQHHSLVVGVLREGSDGLGVALCAGETQHVELSVVRLHARHAVHYGYGALCLHQLHLLLAQLGSRHLHLWSLGNGQIALALLVAEAEGRTLGEPREAVILRHYDALRPDKFRDSSEQVLDHQN